MPAIQCNQYTALPFSISTMLTDDPPLPDTRLLRLLDLLYDTRSVTRAAEHLGLSQPTVSIWLGQLREQYGDPLFVRTPRGMEPTPRADAMIGPAREALDAMRRLGRAGTDFDPATSARHFRICMTDASHITLLPPWLEAGFYQQALYPQDWVCLVNGRHPRLGDTLGLAEYAAEAHVGIAAGTGAPLLAQAMADGGVQRRVLLELPGFLGLGAILSTTDLVATLPRQIGETLARAHGLRVLACPVAIAEFTVKQHWHARYHHDAGNRWLRGVCAALFLRPQANPL
jgi:DNA-binding transcriptional LysR family regulator